ncbi:MAG: AI-2E family transporter [archaeon]
MVDTSNIFSKKAVAVIIFLVLLVVAIFLVKPYIAAILGGIILAYVLRWPYKKLSKLIKHNGWSAGIVCVLAVAILLIGGFFIAQITIQEAFNLYLTIQKIDTLTVVNNIVNSVFPHIPGLGSQITTIIQQGVTTVTNSFISAIGTLITDIPEIMFQSFIILFITFYVLKEWDFITQTVKKLLPFDKELKERFITRSNKVTNATIFGQILIGSIQGLVSGIGFYLFGAPSPLFFTLIAIFAGILPFIGPWVVGIPIGFVMIATGQTVPGILLIVFIVLVAGTIDDIIRPYVVGKKAKINPAIVLIGMLGGLALMGVVGLIVGPLILEYLLIFMDVYLKGTKEED